jgi:hypothetical protein
MIGDWYKQESQLGQLAEQAQRFLTTFRWLWLLNLTAAIVGVVTHRYELMAVAAGSSLIALLGVAFARIGRKTVSATTAESHRIRRKLDHPLR